MLKLSHELKFILAMARANAILVRMFDSRLLHGLSLNDFSILHHLSLAEDERLRRIDLAEKMGLTASGVTRLLLPMEKIGLVKREAHEQDGRVSYVKLSRAGKTALSESSERADVIAEELLAGTGLKGFAGLTEALAALR